MTLRHQVRELVTAQGHMQQVGGDANDAFTTYSAAVPAKKLVSHIPIAASTSPPTDLASGLFVASMEPGSLVEVSALLHKDGGADGTSYVVSVLGGREFRANQTDTRGVQRDLGLGAIDWLYLGQLQVVGGPTSVIVGHPMQEISVAQGLSAVDGDLVWADTITVLEDASLTPGIRVIGQAATPAGESSAFVCDMLGFPYIALLASSSGEGSPAEAASFMFRTL